MYVKRLTITWTFPESKKKVHEKINNYLDLHREQKKKAVEH